MVRAAVAFVVLAGTAASAGWDRRGPASAGVPATSFEETAKAAEAARTSGRIEEAIALYRKGVGLRPRWKEGWWYLGALLYDRNRYAEARDALRQLVRRDPASGRGYGLLGLCEFQTRDYESALMHLERGRALAFSGNEEIRQVASYHLALLLTRSGQYEAALELLLKDAGRIDGVPAIIEAAGLAALRKPLLPDALTAAGRELVMATGKPVWDAAAGRRTLADDEFRALLARYPATTHLHYLYGSFLLKYRPEDGMAELKRELEISPDHVPALVQIAARYLILADYAAALPPAQKAVALSPRSFAARNVLGRSLVALGRTADGIRELEAARDLAPRSPETRAALANAYRTAGRTDDAAREMAELERLREMVRAENAARVAPGQPQ